MAFEVATILANLVNSTVDFLPSLISAVILLLIGLVLGKVIGRLVEEVLDRVKLDYYVTETEKPAISIKAIFALVSRWWVYLAFITAALSNDVLRIPSLALWVQEINSFIPRIIGASAIMVVGYVIAEYIKSHLKKMKTLYAILTGKMIFFFVVYVSVAIALPILGIPADLVSNILLIIIASVGLGMAVAIGLGMKDAVSDVSKRYAKTLKV